MKFERIDFRNFKPFHGTESLEFDPDSDKPLTLVCAKNDVGKTAVLEGINFCFYGFEDDRNEDRTQCINRTAAVQTEGRGETSVTLTVHHDGKFYEIKRGHYFSGVSSAEERLAEDEFMKIIVAPGTDREDVFIDSEDEERDQDIGDAEDFVTDLLPEETVRFFMFDGDRIQAFANQLEDADQGVRDAIELILGIREIQNGIQDLKNIAISHYRSEYNSASSEKKEYEEKKDEREEVVETLEELEAEIEDIESRISDTREELSSKREELAEAEDLEDLHRRYIRSRVELYGVGRVPNAEDVLSEDTIEEIGDSVVKQIRDLRIGQQALYKDFGPTAALVAANSLEGHLPDQDTTIPAALRKILRDKADECLVCGQPFDVDHEHAREIDEDQEECKLCGRPLQITEDDLIERYGEIDKDATDDAAVLAQRIDQATELEDEHGLSRASIEADFGHLDDQFSGLEHTREQLESRIARLDNELDNAMDETERQSLRERRDQLENRLERLLMKQGEQQSEVKSKKEELREIDDELDEMEGATDREERYKRLMNASEQTRSVFQEAREEIVDNQRKRVEGEASRLFMEMSNKSDVYDGLDIDKDYRLRIKVDGEIRDLSEQDPSQGARQIIAYAFNAAVARSASWEAPFVIDTPTGRLDNEHKSKLFNKLPEFGNQTVILYQPREMNKEDIIEFREDDIIANHYQITRESGSSVSEIELLPEDQYTCGDD